MIEPLLWSILCAIAVSTCWANMRTRGFWLALFYLVLGIVFAVSGWKGFLALLAAMDALAAGEPIAPFRETVLIAGPLLVMLAWPFARSIIGNLGGNAHGSA